MKKTKIALIGYGYWGKVLCKYIPEYFECVKIFGRSLSKDGLFTNNLEDILQDTEIKAVIIATPIDTHFEIVKRCLLANKHILCEKPLTLSKEENKELFELAKILNLKLCVDFTYTFSKGVKNLVTIVKDKLIGEPCKILLFSSKILQNPKYNVYATLGSHLFAVLDLMYDLDKLLFYVEGDESEGVVCFNDVGFTLPLDVFVSYKLPKDIRMTVLGTEGCVHYDYSAKNTLTLKVNGSLNTFTYDESDNLKYVLEYFDKVLKNEATENIEMARKVTETLVDIKQELKNG